MRTFDTLIICLLAMAINTMSGDIATEPFCMEGTKVRTQSDAKRVAFAAYVEKMQLEILAEEGVREREITIVTLGYDVRDFAAKGERIWEARVLTIEGRLRAIIWVNPRSENVHLVCGPWEEKNTD